jgi:predicted Holliday junction resolvase-like endonuclease
MSLPARAARPLAFLYQPNPMNKKSKILFTAWSALILLLAIVNVVIALGNQSIQAEVSERQQEITQTIQLETLNRQLITVLANMALKTNDAELKKLLAESGINLDAAPESVAPQK